MALTQDNPQTASTLFPHDTKSTPSMGVEEFDHSSQSSVAGEDNIRQHTPAANDLVENTTSLTEGTTTVTTRRRINFEDWLDLNDIVFEWADSYDNKDWKRLEKILAPKMLIDYSIVGHGRIEDLPASEFIGMMSSPDFLGDPLVRTQHLMGARKFEYLSDTEATGHHQIRAAHQRYCADGTTVENRGHGHSFIQHWYTKVDGVWKLSGLCPKVYWNEHRFDQIFLALKAER